MGHFTVATHNTLQLPSLSLRSTCGMQTGSFKNTLNCFLNWMMAWQEDDFTFIFQIFLPVLRHLWIVLTSSWRANLSSLPPPIHWHLAAKDYQASRGGRKYMLLNYQEVVWCIQMTQSSGLKYFVFIYMPSPCHFSWLSLVPLKVAQNIK